MFFNKKIIGIGVLFIAIFFTINVGAKYIPTNKDTKLPPEKINPDFKITDVSSFTKIYENDNFIYYFKEKRDILAIYDKRNEYLWKTGVDSPSQEEAEEACFDKKRSERREFGCDPIEIGMNFKYSAYANSLLTIEYFDRTRQIIKQSSSLIDPYVIDQYVFSTLQKVDGVDNHFILDVIFKKPEVSIKLHLYFNEKGVNYEVRNEEITGPDVNNLASIIISPFLGASGGKTMAFDKEDDDFTIELDKYRVPGYIFVPDGSGALIRFSDLNTTSPLTSYVGAVYGKDFSQIELNYRTQFRYVALKEPVMPVFGISHGEKEAAFLAYATSGAEHMEIVATPDEGENMNYHFAYPRFMLNNKYYQIYNKQGQNFEKIRDERNHFDLKINYEFLAGDGKDGLPANYIGMAKAYREHLIEENIITVLDYAYQSVPARIDFIMSDVKKTIVGYEDVVVTNINDVEDILMDLNASGVANINSGLIGYQRGGVTLGKPNDIKYNKAIGSKKAFKNAINNLKALGIDVSLSQNFVQINQQQISLAGNTVKHVSNWYTTLNLFDAEATVNQFNYAKADKTAKWVNSFLKDLKGLNADSLTIDGMQNILLTDYGKKLITRQATMEIYQNTLSKIKSNYKINAANPNQYTWEYVDRYLNSPVFNSQYIIQTDTVPFLQLVLYGTMELYAPYSNFSFYTDSDVLRMIDYNVYPSFILSEQPAYLLMSTNSANFYSTEYKEYKDLIKSIYGRVDGALKNVINSEWLDRTVIQNGVIVNKYSNGKEIVINYTNDTVVYQGIVVQPLNYGIIEKE